LKGVRRLTRLLDLLTAARFRVFGRCFVCDRLMAKHTPWALYICERTPLPIRITEKGMAYAVVAEAEHLTAEAAN
jgi:hypothetical protein